MKLVNDPLEMEVDVQFSFIKTVEKFIKEVENKGVSINDVIVNEKTYQVLCGSVHCDNMVKIEGYRVYYSEGDDIPQGSAPIIGIRTCNAWPHYDFTYNF